jgi:hypothetical protein
LAGFFKYKVRRTFWKKKYAKDCMIIYIHIYMCIGIYVSVYSICTHASIQWCVAIQFGFFKYKVGVISIKRHIYIYVLPYFSSSHVKQSTRMDAWTSFFELICIFESECLNVWIQISGPQDHPAWSGTSPLSFL